MKIEKRGQWKIENFQSKCETNTMQRNPYEPPLENGRMVHKYELFHKGFATVKDPLIYNLSNMFSFIYDSTLLLLRSSAK